MATNTTTKKTATATTTAASESVTEAITAEARPEHTPTRPVPVVGPSLIEGKEPVPVTLSHHLRIDGADYQPGSQVRVSPDYARRLRTQGYTSRT
ncbi:hypothetical protein ACFXOM_28470 [Streptomyces sp. NPDC059169]|uniref:hypothetical protein n=1 Tax=Streptomyces sp. NPDC059169 TaxID=3346754 RepID=UPI0036A49077